MDSTEKPLHPPFDPVVADRLLSRLGEDDGFRKLFVDDPEAALREVGHPDAAAALAAASCMKVEQLASKEEILACREQLKHELTSANPYTVVYSFDTGGTKDRLRRK